MASGTTSVDGLYSGLDTTSLIESLAAIRRKPIELLATRVSDRQTALTSYQSLTAQVLALQTYAAGLADGSVFGNRSVSVSDSSAVLASAASGTALGSYDLRVEHLAQAHKLTSGVVADADAALGFSGDFRLNGRTLSLDAADDLYAVRDAINSAGAGVSATILTVSSTEHRLVLNALQTGVDNAVQLAEANGDGFLQSLGLLNGTVTARHALTDGVASDYLSSSQTAVGGLLGLSRPPSGTIAVNGVEVNVDLATDSLQDLADRLNASGAGVTATVAAETTDGVTTYRLELTGAGGAPVLTDATGALEALGVQQHGVANELRAAQNSRIYVDGYAVERATNQLDDVIDGLSLDLVKTTGEDTLTLTVSSNTANAVTALQQMVKSYNSIVGAINSGMAFDTDTAEGGVFFGDYSVINIQSDLYSAAMDPVASLAGTYTLPSQLGLSVDENGLLALDTGVLQEALASDPEAVTALLGTSGTASSTEVSFVSATSNTADSGRTGYAVNLSQAATRATLQSRDLSGGLTQAETLTLNDNCRVTLQAGDSLQTAADKLNAAITGAGLGLTAVVSEGRLQVESRFYGSHYQVRISSSLDQGAGGTDLGGATAGTVSSAVGRDVQGTINGETATGYGQFLTGTSGAVKGLKLQITSTTTGDKGAVTISRGLASRLAAYAASATAETTGVLTQATGAVSGTIDDLQEQIKRLEEGVTDYTDTLKTKFATAEGLLARNTTIMSYLQGQLQGLSSSKDSS